MFASIYSKSQHFLPPSLRIFGDLRFLQISPLFIISSFSSTVTNQNQNQLKETYFTVSYLINSCGLSSQSANSVSKRIHFKTSKRADSMLAFLRKYGFSSSQISQIVKKNPQILLADPEKTIVPKLKFFSSVGMTETKLAKLIHSNPDIFNRSLGNQIVPVYNFLKTALLSNVDMIIKSMILPTRIFGYNLERKIAPNLLVLREIGMTQSVIQLLLVHHAGLLCLNVDKFRNKIKELIDMGFYPTESKFIDAFGAIILSKSSWKHKIQVFERCGLSKDEIMSTFKRYPRCMLISEKKVTGVVDFLVNVMDMKPSVISAQPYILSFSLRNRIISRGLVVKILVSKGVLENNINFYTVLQKNDERFLKEYVEKHREQIPCLVDAFEGRMSPQELGIQCGR